MQSKNIDQLALPFARSEAELCSYIKERMHVPCSITLTTNSTRMLSFVTRGSGLQVRLSRVFLAADGAVLDEIVGFLKKKRGPMPHFRAFLRSRRHELPTKPAPKRVLRTAGQHHDLREIYDRVNERYFKGSITAAITWGAAARPVRARKRTFGSYSDRENLIRINPLLDRKLVPAYYLSFIVYHEMLHAAMGVPMKNGRRSVHSRAFRERERLYHEYERAQEWERKGGWR